MSNGTLLPAPPDGIAEVFGARTECAVSFTERLANEGVLRGMIGPREVGRLWERHILNCAVLGELVPEGAHVIDVGSGAGLPGIPLAIARPDLSVTLVEPMLRRTNWLTEIIEELNLSASVVRGRAEERAVRESVGHATVVTARAVAALDKLAGWCLPLVRPGGVLLAMKGETVREEVDRCREAITRIGGGAPEMCGCGTGKVEQPTTVVRIERVGSPAGGGRQKRTRRSR